MKFLSLIGALAIVIAVAAAVFFFGGFYNVAATQPDLGVVAWALEYVRDASINRHAVDQPPVSMEDPATIQVDARADFLGHPQRHQHDWHARIQSCRSYRPGNLEYCCLR